MVNIALNYGFIENFIKGDRFARRRAKSRDKERNIYVYNEIKSASFVKALDANNAQTDVLSFTGKFARGPRRPSGTGRRRERH